MREAHYPNNGIYGERLSFFRTSFVIESTADFFLMRCVRPDVVSSPTLFSHLRPQSLTVPRLSSSPYSTSTSDLDPPSEMDTPENDDDDDDEDDALQSGHENESKEEDEESSSDDFLVEDMFEMDIDAREEEEGDSGYAEIIPITGDESVKFRSLGMVSSDERTMLE